MKYATASLFAVLLSTVTASEWSYDDPSHWPGVCTTGDSQSPININTNSLTENSDLNSLDYLNYGDGAATHFDLINNGHSIKATFNRTDIQLKDGGLDETYTAIQFHWHFGKTSGVGSEHTIDSSASDAELHIVHQAGSRLAVLGVLISERDSSSSSSSSSSSEEENDETYGLFFDDINDIKFNGGSKVVNVAGFEFSDLLPPMTSSTRQYYRYQGSLTTPNCDEIVTWTVLKDKYYISKDLMDKMREILKTHENETPEEEMWNNFRPTQDLNGRAVFTTV